jgi:hypothetical protein
METNDLVHVENPPQELVVSTLRWSRSNPDQEKAADAIFLPDQIVRLMEDIPEFSLRRGDLGIVISYGDIPMTVRAMKAGAVEFLTKPFTDDALLGAVRNALERSQSTLGHEAEIRLLRDCYASLTPREQEVMALVVSGLTNKQSVANWASARSP